MFTYILFDLDGTISDPKIGITSCVQYALRQMGIEEPDPDRLEPFIGPPLGDSFIEFYGFTQEQAEKAVAAYREKYAVKGLYENELYPGMDGMLRALKKAGRRLAVASSKPEPFVIRILEHFHILEFFEVVTGSGLDGSRSSKEEVVEETLKRFFGADSVPRDEIVMVGDRKFDVTAAKEAGLHSIGAAYGYARPGELEKAGAERIVKDVEELKQVLLK